MIELSHFEFNEQYEKNRVIFLELRLPSDIF